MGLTYPEYPWCDFTSSLGTTMTIEWTSTYTPTPREAMKWKRDRLRVMVQRRRGALYVLMILAGLLLLCCLSGCGTFKPSSTVPGQKDFIKDMTPSSFAEAVDVQERFERLRTELGVTASETESRIRQQESIVNTCRWLGFLLIPGGIIISIWVDRRLGIGLALAGAGAIVLGMFIGGFWFKVASAVVAIGGGLIGGAMAVQKLIIRFQTNKQADAKLERAAEEKAAGNVAEAALLQEGAALLSNVATPEYRPIITAPSPAAVKLIEAGTENK